MTDSLHLDFPVDLLPVSCNLRCGIILGSPLHPTRRSCFMAGPSPGFKNTREVAIGSV